MQGTLKQARRNRRKRGIRKRVVGTPERPRLAVYRSLSHIYAQVIDDVAGKTLAAASSVQDKLEKGGNKDAAVKVGKVLAERAKAAGVSAGRPRPQRFQVPRTHQGSRRCGP